MQLLWMTFAAMAYVAGGYCMKLAAGFTRPLPSVLLFLCFGVGAACQTWAMRSGEMGASYVIVLGLESVLAAFCSAILLHEQWSALRISAALVVLAGMLLLHFSGQR